MRTGLEFPLFPFFYYLNIKLVHTPCIMTCFLFIGLTCLKVFVVNNPTESTSLQLFFAFSGPNLMVSDKIVFPVCCEKL